MKSIQNYGTLVKYEIVFLNHCEIVSPPELSFSANADLAYGPVYNLKIKIWDGQQSHGDLNAHSHI